MDENDTQQFFDYLDKLSQPIVDEKKLQKLFDAWCVNGGISGYFAMLFDKPIPESFNNRDGVRETLGLRNILTCQSHCDLLQNTALLIERYQLKEAEELLPLIRDARSPEWVKLPEIR